MNNNEYIQYGCGWSAPSKWRNFDASPTLRLERLPFFGLFYKRNEFRFPENVEYGDIVKGLPSVPHQSSRGIYCSHVLEHLSLEDFRIALRNTFNMLQLNGIFRLVLPDLEYLAKEYLSNPSSDASLVFMKETYLGHENREKSFKSFIISWLGNSQHLWMWDYKSIEEELANAGFGSIRRATFADCSDSMFLQVESKDRWTNCLGVECKKVDQ